MYCDTGALEGEREMMRRRETAAKWKSKSTTGHRQREGGKTVKAIMETESGGDKVEKGEEKRRVIGVILVASQDKQNEASFPAQGYTELSHALHTQSQILTSTSSSPAQDEHTGGNFKSDSMRLPHMTSPT